MNEDEDEAEQRVTSAVGAFELLSHETRMAAMDVLWQADDQLRFSEIADRAGIDDTGNFNYHFGKLVGHYVRKHGEVYGLTRSGRETMTAVLAGDVTERPPFEPVALSESCPFCDAPIELRYYADELRVLCTSCAGTFQPGRETPRGTENPHGTLSTFAFPPAGVRDREPEAVLDAALLRLLTRTQQFTGGICPDCAGPVERTVEVCADHDDEGICEHCASRFAGLVTYRCETCRTTRSSVLGLVALSEPRLLTAFHDHGHDLFDPTWNFATTILNADEHVHATDPVEYEARWHLDDETLTVRIDGEGTVTSLDRE
jgi:hypothetical protein